MSDETPQVLDPRQLQNQSTQPRRHHRIFDNWGVVAKGWYFALPSAALGRGQARSLSLCGQRLVLWRGADGAVRCLDGFCPHMGTDLGIGTVVGDELRCFFHHWRYDGQGACTHVPAAETPPRTARLRSWAVEECYGMVWVYPDAVAPRGVPRHRELEGVEVDWVHGRGYARSCHHHVTMINGIDPQHLKTVHGIDIEMQLELDETSDGSVADYTLRGELPSSTFAGRMARRLLGPRYGYRMRYAHGTIGLLTILKDTSWFGSGLPLPELYMLFAYRPVAPGRTEVLPIYLAPRGRGLLGRFASVAKVWGMKLAFGMLRDEDGKVYENMRFRPESLLAMDAPVARYISWVDRLEPSDWHLVPDRVEV